MTDFIRQIIERDLEAGKYPDGIVTRFPPEPNGFLHIGHAKSIVLNFGIAEEREQARAAGRSPVRGRCHLRFDDTNPLTEETAYVRAIQEDVRWLGFDWGDHLYFASDYFQEMYGFAEELIRKGLAYIDSSSEEEIREARGTVKAPGTPSRDRDRPAEESLELFGRMRAGAFEDGAFVLRARIDMASPNMLMRDPVLYRIRHATHHRTGDAWCIYPLYDFAHPLEDAIEGVTHSLCTLEFENNRELYDWIVENCSVPSRPRQYEFARLNLDYTVMSKRKLLRLVQAGDVEGWDDPRMPTVAGIRRRGYTPEAIRAFCRMIGVTRTDSRVDMEKLEYAVRDDLNPKVPRVMAVRRPLRVVLTDWPEGEVEALDAPYFPHDVPLEGSRRVPFSGELWIERDDFAEDPPKGFRRLVPGGEVRLRYGYIIRCDEVVKDADGEVVELRCSHDPGSRGGDAPDGRKVKGTIHWLSAEHALPCTFRLYDRLFRVPDPEEAAAERGEDADFRDFLNPDSLEVREGFVEPSVAADPADTRYQFERLGYFWRDPVDSGAPASSEAVGEADSVGEPGSSEAPGASGGLVFNRIVTLRDTWAARAAKEEGGREEGRDGAEAKAGAGGRPAAQPKAAKGRGSAGDRADAAVGERPPLSPEVKARAEALAGEHGVAEVDAEILARDPALEGFYRRAVAAYAGPGGKARGATALANWIINALPPVQDGRKVDELPFGPSELARLVALVEDGTLSSRGGSEVLDALAREGGDPDEVVARLDLAQVSDADALRPLVSEVVRSNPDEAEAYRGGRTALLGFFMGRVMRSSGGKADPEMAKALLQEILDGGG